MKITTDLLKSKLARRFCLLFIFCALLPTICLFYISFIRVTEQLERQNYQKIKQETKSYGISLFDRLVRIDNTLRSLASVISSDSVRGKNTADFIARPANQLFEAMTLYYPEGKSESLLGHISAEESAEIIREITGWEKTRLVVRSSHDQANRLIFAVPILLANELKYYLIGEARLSYVWGIGSESLLPSKTQFSVYGDSGRRIIGSSSSPGSEVDGFNRETVESDLRFFKYTVDGRKFLASAWMLFVKSNFANENWTIILAESENSIISTLRDFKYTFLLITLLSLSLSLFLALTLIRRNLTPLHLLKNGTERISNKDYTVTLDIQSGDEFEELGNSFNSMTKQLQKQFYTLATIDKIDRAILSSLDLTQVIETSLQMLKEFFHVESILLGQLYEPTKTKVKLHILENGQGSVIEFATLQGIENDMLSVQPYALVDEVHFPEFLRIRGCSGCAKMLCLPLIFENQFQSFLLLGFSKKHLHDEEELKQARQLADQITIALSNAKLVTDLEKLILGTIEALARTVDAKSKWTAGHSERVAVLAGRIGLHMGLSEFQIDLLNRGGLLHDIGKIGVPMAILDKPDKLTEEEFLEIKSHPLIGKQILDPIEAYEDIIPMVVQHHEWYDGTGYPYGLSGENIDQFARILMVADVFDALTSTRPYREGWVLENARNYLIQGAGSQFDPNVVSAFLELSHSLPLGSNPSEERLISVRAGRTVLL